MLIEDRSTTPDYPPQSPRRWPKRLLVGGLVTLVLAAVAAFIVSAFALSGSGIEPDGSSLGKVTTDSLGGEVESVSATLVKSGKDVPVKFEGCKIVPTGKVHAGAQIKVEAKVKRPSEIGWLAGGTTTVSQMVTMPAAKLEEKWLIVKGGKNPRLTFDQPVSEIAYGTPGEMTHRKLDKPVTSVSIGKQPTAGTTKVRWAMPFEKLGKSKTVTWFPGTGTPIVAANPTAGTTISASTPLELTLSKPVKKIFGSEDPKLSPEIPGKWKTKNRHTLVFTPSGFGAPLAAEIKVVLPEKLGIVQSDGSTDEATTVGWNVPAGSQLRLQQMLAQLGYLAWNWDGEEVAKTPEAMIAAATTEVPKGHFTPRWSNTPGDLKALWEPGKENVLIEGALMSFEERNGLEVDGIAGPVVWEALMKALIAGEVKPEKGAANGYTYVWVNESTPETVNVWHNGKMIISEAPANTGIAGAETELGTHNVYSRFEETTMSGTNPDGSHYNDPGIKWVSYFYEGDALHQFDRASYGSPQSLGCVEMPEEEAETIWPYTPLGTPVTVNPA
ncbi:MAG TPA: L,D-transpeptidase family protein [Solirubrobacterales bacterium]